MFILQDFYKRSLTQRCDNKLNISNQLEKLFGAARPLGLTHPNNMPHSANAITASSTNNATHILPQDINTAPAHNTQCVRQPITTHLLSTRQDTPQHNLVSSSAPATAVLPNIPLEPHSIHLSDTKQQPGSVSYCVKLGAEEYEEQRSLHSQQLHLLELLHQIVQDYHSSDDSKRARLQQVKHFTTLVCVVLLHIYCNISLLYTNQASFRRDNRTHGMKYKFVIYRY